MKSGLTAKVSISLPLGNVVGGGAHASGRRTDIQEFLVVPTKASSAVQAAEANVRAHGEVAKLAMGQGLHTMGKGDEGLHEVKEQGIQKAVVLLHYVS